MSLLLARKNQKFLLLIAALISPLISAFLVLHATSNGINVGPDSVAYLSVADHLVDGSGFTLFDDKAYVDWPPLFPIILAALKSSGVDPIGSAPVINAVVLALITLVGSLWIISNLNSGVTAFFGMLLVTFSPPLINISRWLFTEPLFILLMLLSLVMLGQYGRSGVKAIIGAGLFASLAWLTRYAGVTVVITGIIFILSKGAKKRDLRNALVFTACAVIPAAVWLTRNWVVAGTFTGERAPSEFSLLMNADRIIRVLSTWFVPETLSNYFGGFLLATLWAIAFVALFMVTAQKLRLPSRLGSFANIVRLPIYPFLLFVLCYSLFMLISATTIAFESLDNRMLLPLYLPLVFLIVFYFDQLHSVAKENNSQYAGVIAIVILVALTSTPVYDGILNSIPLKSGLNNFNSDLWHKSETLNILRHGSVSTNLYSDCPYAIYFLLSQSVHRLPRKFFFNSPARPAGELAAFEQAVKGSKEPVYLAWFDWQTNFLFSFVELQQVVDLRPITVASDGTLYEVLPKKQMTS